MTASGLKIVRQLIVTLKEAPAKCANDGIYVQDVLVDALRHEVKATP